MTVNERHQAYLQRIAARNPKPQETGFRCLCCRDSAIIPDWLIRKYVEESYNAVDFPTEPPCLCKRKGCFANELKVDVKGESQTVERYREDCVAPLNPLVCQRIHDKELEELKAIQAAKSQPQPELAAKFRELSAGMTMNKKAKALSADERQAMVEKSLAEKLGVANG